MIRVTTKRKLVGPFKNNGHEGEPRAEPAWVGTHGFPDRELHRAVPYSIYDDVANADWVNVGTDHDNAAFAIVSDRRSWNVSRQTACPTAGRILITAKAYGSNECRTRTWKTELAHFAARAGPDIAVCHLAPGSWLLAPGSWLLAPGSWNSKLEPNRTPAVLPHHHELA
ncbi:ISAzo13-like element transposase-related protein [Streptomyces sp. JV176]|uniref:ISAzo13-like element transposase-related protein n=1 Tax=Streptomyces sp. JV176 TaxID=858630 RepID=UPI003FA7D40E